MALPPNLPPQAYTRDTLVKAIEWLTTQPAAVRERANSADLIVSHYLAARRRTPFAGETAAADFRSLADDLRDLDEPALSPAPEPSVDATPVAPTAPVRPRRREAPRAPVAAEVAEEDAPPSTQVGPARGQPDTAVTLKGLIWTVDSRSRSIAREVQDRMNLSTEGEALRMLVAMGAERLRSVLP